MAKQTIKNHVGNLHLYILTGLILVFFGILFLSTAFKDVDINYTFNEQISTSNMDEIELGTVSLKNKGPITAKIDLKKLVACDKTESIELRYISDDIDRYGYYEKVSTELGSKKSDEIKIFGSKYIYNDDKNNSSDLSLDLYIYELRDDQYSYSYCKTADKVNAFANIKVN